MILPPEKIESHNRGEAVPVKLDQTECVILRKDVYQTMRQSAYDDRDWTEAELERLAEQTFDGLDEPEAIRP